MALTFTTIQHSFRKVHGLSMNEYTLCDMIYFLSTKPATSVPGWCYMSKAQMADEIGCSKQAILNMIARLVEAGFLIRNQETKYLKTTEKWQKVYDFSSGKESLPSVNKVDGSGKETLPDAGKESLPNNNIIDNYKIKSESEDSISVSLLDKAHEIFNEAGLKGQFFGKIKSAYGLTDHQLKTAFDSWKTKHRNLTTEFKNSQHLKNSFNRFLAESKVSGGKQVPVKVTGGRLIG